MFVIKDLVEGDFSSEQEFKAAVLKKWRSYDTYVRFEIENEEKVPGMPDVLSIARGYPAFFTEFKISNGAGEIKFQKTQLWFYRAHEAVYTNILAWDTRYKCVVCIDAQEVVLNKSLAFKLPSLTNVEVI